MPDQPPLPTRDSLSDMSAEDQSPPPHAPAPRDQPPAKEPTACLRQTARQATSAVAFTGDEPEDDDPLLALAHACRLRFRSDSAPKP